MKWQLWLSPDEMYDKEQFPQEWANAHKWRLPAEWLPALCDKAHSRGMAFGLSSFGFASLDEADKWVDFHKVASIEAQWVDFVERVIRKDKPTIISKGMSEVNGWGIGDHIDLHCTVAYPASLEDVNLRSAPDMEMEPNDRRMWGLSDHTTHPTIAPCAAVSLGSCVVEKHIRLGQPDSFGMQAYGCDDQPPDWNHSLWPAAFAEMVSAIRLTEQALGSSEKRIRPSEEKFLKYRRGPRGLRGA